MSVILPALRMVGTLIAVAVLLSACVVKIDSSNVPVEPLVVEVAPIKLNQIGYQISTRKVAIVPAVNSSQSSDLNTLVERFNVIRIDDDEIAYSGELSAPIFWEPSNETVQQANFSALREAGNYLVRVEGVGDSYPFEIGDMVLSAVHKAALRSYYLNRPDARVDGQNTDPKFNAESDAGASTGGHQAGRYHHGSASGRSAPVNNWYDATYNGREMVHFGIATYTLLTAYEHFSDYYQHIYLDIPESGNRVPDLIDEVKWNLDWMERMQDVDGGVYPQLADKQSPDSEILGLAKQSTTSTVNKSLNATLNYAAVMAVASRVMRGFEAQFPGLSARYKDNATRAYQWASDASVTNYQPQVDHNANEYSSNDPQDEFAWAAAELFLLTKERRLFGQFLAHNKGLDGKLSPTNVSVLAYASLINAGESLLSDEAYTELTESYLASANRYIDLFKQSAYDVVADRSDFGLSSNFNILNKGFFLIQAYRLAGDSKYRDAAFSSVDYVLGRNATGYSFVTGHGGLTPVNIARHSSAAIDTAQVMPGVIVSGPNIDGQDKCQHAGDQPATRYADSVCSNSNNELASSWNAMLVYMLAAKNNLD